jgi:hypothetical protein
MTSAEAPAEEPQGHASIAGFVKARPENNDHYVEQFKDDPWYPAIKWAHDQLTELVPGYNIAQIKGKFGGLRFYAEFPDEVLEAAVRQETLGLNTTAKVLQWAEHVIDRSEAWVDGFEAARCKYELGFPTTNREAR